MTATTATTAMSTMKTRTRKARTNDKVEMLRLTRILGSFIFSTTTDPGPRSGDGARAKARRGGKCAKAPGRTCENAPWRKGAGRKGARALKRPGEHAPTPGRKGDGQNASWAKMRRAKRIPGSKPPKGRCARRKSAWAKKAPLRKKRRRAKRRPGEKATGETGPGRKCAG